jgi:hypothetical protein
MPWAGIGDISQYFVGVGAQELRRAVGNRKPVPAAFMAAAVDVPFVLAAGEYFLRDNHVAAGLARPHDCAVFTHMHRINAYIGGFQPNQRRGGFVYDSAVDGRWEHLAAVGALCPKHGYTMCIRPFAG